MARRRYFFNLSSEERRRLEGVVRKGKSPARAQFKARILLLSDASERGGKAGGQSGATRRFLRRLRAFRRWVCGFAASGMQAASTRS